MNNPKFSFLMSVYNGESYLEEALNSISKQTYRDFEVILVNDGSSDNTLKIMEAFKKKSVFHVLIIDKQNSGLTKSLNIGLSKCRGSYIVRHDADDISLHNRLEILNKITINNDEFIATKAICFSDKKSIKTVPNFLYTQKTAFDLEVLSFGNIHVHGTFCIAKNILSQIKYNESIKFAQDFDLLLRAIKKGIKCIYLNDETYKLRIQSNSISQKHTQQQKQYCMSIIQKHIGKSRTGSLCKAFMLIKKAMR